MAVPRNSIQTIVTAKTLSSVAYIGRRFPVKFSFFLIFFEILFECQVRNAPATGKCSRLMAMYEDFHVTDPWTREDLHCRWTANVVAIATRHADAVDIRFEVNGRPVWIAMPAIAWVVEKQRSGHVITDRLAAQAAGGGRATAAGGGDQQRREKNKN